MERELLDNTPRYSAPERHRPRFARSLPRTIMACGKGTRAKEGGGADGRQRTSSVQTSTPATDSHLDNA